MPTLRSGEVVLRSWRLEDLAAVRAAAADPYIPQTTTVPRQADDLECRRFIERQWDRARSGLGYSFAICHRGTAVGQIGLWPREGATASIGYWVVPSARGQGLAHRALTLLADWAFTRGVRELEVFVEPWNKASLATARRSGFVVRGRARASDQFGGEQRHVIKLIRESTVDGGSPGERGT